MRYCMFLLAHLDKLEAAASRPYVAMNPVKITPTGSRGGTG